jgi:hypothetical protein
MNNLLRLCLTSRDVLSSQQLDHLRSINVTCVDLHLAMQKCIHEASAVSPDMVSFFEQKSIIDKNYLNIHEALFANARL